MKYDIIIIGAGSAGLNIAGFMNKAGFKVLLIDKSDENIGGDCLNFGCIPSKALIHISKLVHSAKESEEFGLKINGKVNIKAVMDYIKDKKEIIRLHENAAYFRKIGMDVVLGLAKFASKNSVLVNGKEYFGKKIVIATGSRPNRLNASGIEKVKYYTNESIFSMKKLPEELLVVGGGPIGIEMSQALNRLGSRVTVIDHHSYFLPKESTEIAKVLFKKLKEEGIKFYFNSKIQKFVSPDEVLFEDSLGKSKKLKFDVLLVSIGRQLNIDGLDLDKAGIERDGSKLKVDDYLRTTNKNVYVCGDVAGSYQFTHAAELHAGVLINNFFSPFKKKLNNDNLSWVTYTSPEIATFGLNEQTLDQRGVEYEKLVLDFEDDDRSIVDNYVDGKLILFVGKNKILGGSMAAMNAGEIIQELVLMNTSKMDIKNIFNKIYPYPTASRVNKKIISNHFSKKLNSFSKKILKLMYR